MGSLSDYAELELLDHIFEVGSYTPVATVYVALCEADPTDAGTGASITESSYTGYAREAVTYGAAASRSITNSGTITFTQSSGGSSTVTHWAILDSVTTGAGNMLAHGSLSASKNIVSGNTPSFAASELDITVSANEVSDYLANLMLDFMFRNQTFTVPNIHVALCTATVSDSDTGSTISEQSGNGYARVDYGVWDTAAAGATENTNEIAFPTATGDWTQSVAVAILDASTLGNLLMYDNTMADQTVQNGDTAKFPAGDLDVTLD